MPRPKSSTAESDDTILGQMLESSEFVSRSALAETINNSRVSVWGHLDKLRKEELEEICNRGYRIEKLPETLHSSLLKAYLDQVEVSAPFIFIDETDSTNSEAERQIANGTATPTVIVAKKQTAGRGRQGRKWASSDAGNLYCSFAFKPDMPPTQIQAISLWMALCLCDFIKEQLSLPAQVKWPNDVIISGKKISGFLAEARIDADHTRDFIFGLGININSNPSTWPADLRDSATSLSAHSSEPFNINSVAARFIKCILDAYNTFISGRYKASLQELWIKYDSLADKSIEAYQGSTTLSGKAVGIDDEGALKLLLTDGTVKTLNNAEVSLTHK